MDKNFWNKLGYRFGAISVSVVFVCIISIIVSLTLKFLFWLF